MKKKVVVKKASDCTCALSWKPQVDSKPKLLHGINCKQNKD